MRQHRSLQPWFTTFIASVIILLVGAGLYFYSLFQPVNQGQTETATFVIPRGQAVNVIAQRLEDAGFIRSQLVFRLVIKQQDLENKLQAGSFQLSPAMDLATLASQLTQGTNDLWVTIPEGWRREQIAQSLASQELPAFNVDEFLSLTIGLEGQLFPDTYLFARESTTATIVQVLVDNFKAKVVTGLEKEISVSPHNFSSALIMASMIEREAAGWQEMHQVAGILWHRSELGMPLQVDATLQYLTGYDETSQSWWAPPASADKQLDSPFNTYLYADLPPAPICNPGLSAIKAALDPAKTDYLYYLHDRAGGIHYAQTFKEHNANVQQYLRWLFFIVIILQFK